MIGGGLALNDIGFILVQATRFTSSLSRSVTLFLRPGARSLQWGYKREGERWGYKRSGQTLVRGAESDGSSAMCYVFERVLEVRTWWFCCCVLVNLIDLNQLSCVGESASPFIDEGDGLTSERERVQILLSLVAHADGYRMMVGAHNTVECHMHMGGGVVFFGHGRCQRLPHC